MKKMVAMVLVVSMVSMVTVPAFAESPKSDQTPSQNEMGPAILGSVENADPLSHEEMETLRGSGFWRDTAEFLASIADVVGMFYGAPPITPLITGDPNDAAPPGTPRVEPSCNGKAGFCAGNSCWGDGRPYGHEDCPSY